MESETEQEIIPAEKTFTNKELARLAIYRSAIAAGFYTDWDGTTYAPDASLREIVSVGSDMYPFTTHEMSLLERGRAAVEAGYYTDGESNGLASPESARTRPTTPNSTSLPNEDLSDGTLYRPL